jgi:hypothetical protein
MRRPSRNSSTDKAEPLSRFGNAVNHAPVEADLLIRGLSMGVAVV